MIERIIAWSIRRRVLLGLIVIALVAAGVWGVATMPVDAIPDLSENQVIVYTEWMGRSPQIIEDQVTYPIVSALQGLPDVTSVRASSMFGMSFVFVVFDGGVDTYFARNRVQERLVAAQAKLPNGVVATMGPDGTGVGHVYWYTVEGEGYDLGALRAVQDWYIRYKLAGVDGVAEVASIGGFVRQYQVDIDPRRLRAYGLTLPDVVTALQRSNNEVGGKLLDVSGAELFVRGQGYLTSRADVEAIPVSTRTDGIPVTIGQLGTVQLGGDIRRGTLEKGGNGEVVGGIIVMRQGENARAVIDRVKEKIVEITPALPPGVKVVTAYDRTPLIEASIVTLKEALLEEMIVVAIIVLVFILNGRSALRILIGFPISVLIGILLMRLFGIQSNIMSLGGIALAIGEIVDASIVVVENVSRALAEAQAEGRILTAGEYLTIVVTASQQVGRAIFFSAAIMTISFLPVLLLEGQEGRLFHPLAWTKMLVIGASALVAITVTPLVMTLFPGGQIRPEARHALMRVCRRLYEPLLRLCLQWPKTTIAVNVFTFIAMLPLVGSIGSEFMPPLDEGSILFMPILLPNASITEVGRVMRYQDSIIAAYPEVDRVIGKAGRAETATDNAPVSMIETIIILKPRSAWRSGITKERIVSELDTALRLPGVRNGWTQPIINRINMLTTGVRTELGVKIYGEDLDTLEHYAVKAERIVAGIAGASDVTAERVQGGTFLDITIDQRSAARYGIDLADLQMVIEVAIGGENLGQVIDGRARYPIRIRYPRELRDNIQMVGDVLVPIGSTGAASGMPQPKSGGGPGGMNDPTDDVGRMSGMGGGRELDGDDGMRQTVPSDQFMTDREPPQGYVRLRDVADIRVAPGPSMISSENGELRSVVYLNVRDRDMGGFVDEAERALDAELNLPAGYAYEWSGQYENKRRADRRLMIVVPIVLVVIFLMLYMTMRDWAEAGAIMLSVPFALIGGLALMALLRYNFSVAVWVGFISLYGVAVQTGIVMMIYLRQALDLRLAEGRVHGREDIEEATVDGAVGRLRPKLMAAATTMIGLVPIMFSTGAGSDVMKPLMTPMIGGMVTSMINVLLMTPVLFVLLKEYDRRRGRLEKSRMTEWVG